MLKRALFGGKECEGEPEETIECTIKPCPGKEVNPPPEQSEGGGGSEKRGRSRVGGWGGAVRLSVIMRTSPSPVDRSG